MSRQRFRPRRDRTVVAVQLRLQTEGLHYTKWGHAQCARAGDWLVDNDGDVYTVEADSFARTYQSVGKGLYVKTTCVWAEQASEAGHIATKEGQTAYQRGDWLVSNEADGSDAYAIAAERFHTLYEPDA